MSSLDKKRVWEEVLESIKITVSGANFSTWFTQTQIVELNKTDSGRSIIEIGCGSSFVKNTLETRYYGLLQDSLSKNLEMPVDLIFSVKQGLKKISEKPTPLFEISDKFGDSYHEAVKKAHLRPYFTFENFAVSSSNQMAWAASDAVSKNPGTAYNPLFIWGGVGVGKTHLMNAVGYKVLEKDTDSNILFCTSEDFTNEIVEGIRSKTTQSFRNKYRKLKALLIDDIQFIAGKDSVQEEFFHTFNTLVSAGSQIILTSDRPPTEMSKVEERLKSRFEAGLIVDVGEPDFELRCAIVQIKAKQKGLEIPLDLVHLIAGNVDKARQIEGFIAKILTETSIKGKEIGKDLIENLLGKGEDDNARVIKASPNDVIDAVSKYYSLGKRKLLGTSRTKTIARPRQILMYLLRTQLALPYQEVGRVIGGKDHSTVIHAVEKITNLASNDVQTREDIRGIKKMF